MQISREALQPLTHIRHELAQGRVIPLIPVWDGSGWKQWLPGPRGDLVLARVRDVAWGEYLATKPAGTTDLWFPFLEFMLQRASWPNVSRAVAAIIDDMAGLATSLSKCDFYWQQRVGLEPLLAGEYVRTEVEYVLVVARSLLDHLQEVLSALWNTVRLNDAALQKRKRSLPCSIADVVIAGDELRVPAQIEKKWGVPATIAQAYVDSAPFIRDLRRGREAVVHGGSPSGPILVLEAGFGIARGGLLHKIGTAIWRDEHRHNDKVISLRPLLAYLAVTPLFTCNAMVESFARCIEFPEALAPEYRVFTRLLSQKNLIEAREVLGGQAPWSWPTGSPPQPKASSDAVPLSGSRADS